MSGAIVNEDFLVSRKIQRMQVRIRRISPKIEWYRRAQVIIAVNAIEYEWKITNVITAIIPLEAADSCSPGAEHILFSVT